MDRDNRVEILLVALAAVVLAWLWFANRAAGAGTGIGAAVLPLSGISDNNGTPVPASALGPINLTQQGGVTYDDTFGGDTFDIGAITIGATTITGPTLGGVTLNLGGGQPGSCTCGGTVGNTFGSEADLSNYLSSGMPGAPNAFNADPNSFY